MNCNDSYIAWFTKNLSPDKISLSALKGEGELANLELDETVLMDILELPTWLRLSKAICNRVAIKIQWTKLKTQPICLYLDEVVLEVETCEEPRSPNNPQMPTSNVRPGKYGFVERAIDGIYVHINSVQVNFRSKTFQASLQMSRVKVHSVTPTWQVTSDLRLTRLKDIERAEVIIFKEVDWQATRIEAQAVDTVVKGVITQTPIRLIANQAKLRIAVKKNMNDCSIVSSRVILLLDDLLWVLTETQLKAALLYATSLQEVIEKSAQQSKQLAAEKLKKQGHIASDKLKRIQMMKQAKEAYTSKASRVFSKFDVLSTSYHLITSRIDLHLCDDMQPRKDSSSTVSSKIEGGAMQVTLNKLSLDYYPFNPAGGERKQWYRYSDQVGSRNLWVGGLFASHKKEVHRARAAFGMSSPSQSPSHSTDQPQGTSSTSSSSAPSTSPAGSSINTSTSSTKLQMSSSASNTNEKVTGSTSGSGNVPNRSSHGGEKRLCLLESCFVLEVDEFTIFCISTADNKRNNPHKFFSSEKKVLHLPQDMPILHMEFTEYYYPEGVNLPVPHANLYVLMNPVQLRVDYLTLLWVNYFVLQLTKNLKENTDGPREHIDIKFEALMPKLLIPAENGSHPHMPGRPDTLVIQVSKMSATNKQSEEDTSHEKLLLALEEQSKCCLLNSTDFPMDQNEYLVCPRHVCSHVLEKDCLHAYVDPYVKLVLNNYKLSSSGSDAMPGTNDRPDRRRLKTNSLKLNAAYDIWNIHIDQIWMDFTTRKSRPVPFLESFPVTFWCWRTEPCKSREKERDSKLECKSNVSALNGVHDDSDTPKSGDSNDSSKLCDNAGHTDICAILCIKSKIQLLITHYQYLFVLRLAESLTAFQKQLVADTEYFSGTSAASTISLSTFVQDIEVAMVFHKPSDTLFHNENMTEAHSSTIKGSIPELSLPDRQSELDGWPNGDTNNYDGSLSYISKSYSDSRLNLSKHRSMNGEMTENLIHEDSMQPLNSMLETSTPNINLCSNDDVSEGDTPLSLVSYNTASDSVYSTINSLASTDNRNAVPTVSSRKTSFKSEKKKVLSTAWSNFTDKLRSMGDLNDDSFAGSEDMEPSQTDYSSDDECFEHLSLEDAEELPAFERKQTLDTQGSFETASQDSSLETTSTAREKQQISVSVFHLSRTEACVQSLQRGTVVRCQLHNIDVIESKGFTWEGFHRKFTSSKGLQYETKAMSTEQFPIRLKYMVGPDVPELKNDLIAQELGFLHVDLADINLTFQMSALMNITDLIEDEVPPVFMPLYVSIKDLTLTLQEDRPSSSGNTSLPPTVISLHQSIIDRGNDGVFHIRGARRSEYHKKISKSSVVSSDFLTDVPPEAAAALYGSVSSSNRIIEQLYDQNERLQATNTTQAKTLEDYSRLAAEVESLKDENQKLRDSLEEKSSQIQDSNQNFASINLESLETENLKLLQRITYLEEEVQTSVKEKDSLLATMHLLQEELLSSEQQRTNFQNLHSPNKT
ncbi:UHRF1-binding protein 1-like isoform X2 [Argonauta hians]